MASSSLDTTGHSHRGERPWLYSAKAPHAVIKLRKLVPEKCQASEAILDLYMNAIGMI
ncbi:hypothetical protein KL86PLE_130277 [uncultured Pleomorphomonas sp.]|uniref:GapR-like DNA-binding domain-containing protein n=1 Tax=uncultured Pleomorphomonas sp. TaxID=442121 RepID=A0A212LAI9_9HYPH|nr:hypothetical protein KL86PLE_130277 [uncultured Pleomorphomonas sp.]